MRDDFEKRFETGDWITECWLLKPDALKNLRYHFTENQVGRIVKELAKLLPPEICISMNKCDEFIKIPELFVPFIYLPPLYSLLYLGHDLAAVEDWEKDANLKSSLRMRDTFYDRRVEVGICAGLVRSGLQVIRPPDRSSAKKPVDFIVKEDGKNIFLEVKVLPSSEKDLIISDANFKLFTGLINSRTKSLHKKNIRIEVNDVMKKMLDDFNTRKIVKETLDRKIPEAVRIINEKSACDTQFPEIIQVEDLGRIIIQDSPEPNTGSFGIANLEETLPEYNLLRILRTLKRGANKTIEKDSLFIVLIHSSVYIVPADYATRYVAEEIEHNSDSYGYGDMIDKISEFKLGYQPKPRSPFLSRPQPPPPR